MASGQDKGGQKERARSSSRPCPGPGHPPTERPGGIEIKVRPDFFMLEDDLSPGLTLLVSLFEMVRDGELRAHGLTEMVSVDDQHEQVQTISLDVAGQLKLQK
eukprot:5634991-Amphidinium_carterae.1